MESEQELVAVTGASGFIAGQIVYLLLDMGYKVRGTVRSLQNKAKISKLLTIHPSNQHNLELVEADLLDKPEKWEEVLKGCKYVIHVASPFPLSNPKNADELIKPAVQGTKSVLEASLKLGVKKVVVTSSIAAVYSKENLDKFLSEEDWSNPASIAPYAQSKYFAEQEVWKFYKAHSDKIDVTTVNPGLVFGPNISGNDFTSGDIIKQIFHREIPGCPNISFSCVDVRDVAFAHIQAMKNENSKGQRYCLSENTYTFQQLILILSEEFEKQGYRFNKKLIAYCGVKFVSIFKSEYKQILPYWGKHFRVNNKKSIEELGITYKPTKESIIEMAYDLLEKQYIRKKK